MAETFDTILKDSLSLIDTYEAESEIQSVDAQLAARTLNRMMAKLKIEGIDLNYTDVDSIDDYITVPDGALEGIVSNLAARLGPHYLKAGTPPFVTALAISGKRSLLIISRRKIKLKYPSTLPMGSGTQDDCSVSEDIFYPDSEPNIIALFNNTGATITIVGSDTPVKISEGWSQDNLKQFETDGTGEFRFLGETGFFTIRVSLSVTVATGTDNCTFYIYKNGEKVPMSLVTKSLTAGTVSIINMVWVTKLSTNDEIEYYCENDDEAVNIIISDGVSRIT